MKSAYVLLIAAFFACGSTIKDNYGNQIGTIDQQGSVKDNYGVQVGTITPQGAIKDNYGNQLGTVTPACPLPQPTPKDGE